MISITFFNFFLDFPTHLSASDYSVLLWMEFLFSFYLSPDNLFFSCIYVCTWIFYSPNTLTSWIHREKWYFVIKIVPAYCKKKLFSCLRKTFEIWGWMPRICKIFEIIRTIYSNREKSEQFLVTEWFFNLFLEVS